MVSNCFVCYSTNSIFIDDYNFCIDKSPELNHFNSSFITAWQQTKNYQVWLNQEHSAIMGLEPCHPFAGQSSLADMKLRISQYVIVYY